MSIECGNLSNISRGQEFLFFFLSYLRAAFVNRGNFKMWGVRLPEFPSQKSGNQDNSWIKEIWALGRNLI